MQYKSALNTTDAFYMRLENLIFFVIFTRVKAPRLNIQCAVHETNYHIRWRKQQILFTTQLPQLHPVIVYGIKLLM